MTRYTVSLDLLVPVLVEVEADNEDDAVDHVFAMPKAELLELANTEDSAIGIVEDGVTTEPAP